MIALIIALIMILPMAFKGKMKDLALEQANQQLNATVGLKDVDLSLISSFPNFTFTLMDITIDGVGKFQDVRLLEIGSVDLKLDLMSVISGEQINLKRIAVSDVHAHLLVTRDGVPNYDIVKPSDAVVEETPASSESSAFKISLKHYELNNFNLHYVDEQSDLEVKIRELYHSGDGDFTEEIVALRTETKVDAITAISEGIAYLNKASVSSDFDMSFNQSTSKVDFGENNLILNALELKFNGFVWPKGDEIEMDMSFSAPGSDFKSVLSMVPSVFLQEFESVQTSGQFQLNGKVQGSYSDSPEGMPGFEIGLDVANGRFNYPSLPAGVEGINIDLDVSKPQGSADKVVINLNEARAIIAENPIAVRLLLKTPISDPQFDLAANGRIELSSLANVVPMEGFDYRGLLELNFKAAGKQSDIDAAAYDKVGARGEIIADNLHFEADSLPFIVEVQKAQLEFTPQAAKLTEASMTIGKSDMSMNGSFDNLIGYALGNDTLKGRFNFSSNLLDLNELAAAGGESQPTEETPDSVPPMEVIRIPTDVDFMIQANVGKLVYSNLDIQDLKGKVRVAEGAAGLNDVSMKMLGGGLIASGEYNSLPSTPEVNMDFKMNSIGFRESYEAFEMVQQLAPVMEKTSGTYSTSFKFNSELGSDMTPDLNSIYAKGVLKTSKLTSEPEAMKKLADVLKDPSLEKLELNSLDIDFEIKDGRLYVEPFDIASNGVKGTVSGSTGLDQTIDYKMDMNVPTSRISKINLLGSSGIQLPSKVDVGVGITGTSTSPKITTSLGDLASNIADEIVEQATEIVEEKIEEVKEDANEAAQKLIDDAEAQGDKLIAEAQRQGDALVAEAKKKGDELRNEADKQAKKIEDDAKGNFLKEAAAKEAAKKLRKEADKKAKKLEKEAQKQSDALVKQAEDQKAKLVEDARNKAKID